MPDLQRIWTDAAIVVVSTTSTGAGASVTLPPRTARDEVIVQFDFTSTGSVTLEGRVDPNLAWVTIVSAQTVNAIVPISYCPYIRSNVASNGGTIAISVAAS